MDKKKHSNPISIVEAFEHMNNGDFCTFNGRIYCIRETVGGLPMLKIAENGTVSPTMTVISVAMVTGEWTVY